MNAMKTSPLALALLVSIAAGSAQAQTAVDDAAMKPVTRAEVVLARDAFLNAHRWDEVASAWIPAGADSGGRTRAEVVAERDAYLASHQWDETHSAYVPGPASPATLAMPTRAQMRGEAVRFQATHHWNDLGTVWDEN